MKIIIERLPVTKNFIIFHPLSRRWIVHIVKKEKKLATIKPLNNLGSLKSRSFPFSLRSLPRVQGRGAQSPGLKETLTHGNTPCRRRHLLYPLPPPPFCPPLSTPRPLPRHLSSLLPSQPLSLPVAWFLPFIFQPFFPFSTPPSVVLCFFLLLVLWFFLFLSFCATFHHCPW